MIDPHKLNVFLVAADTLNFSRAAERLHMSQPSVTQHIRSLEAGFGSPLFIRNGHHLTLSEAGQALLPMAREMVSYSKHLSEVMESYQKDVYGHLMVACSTTPGKYILPGMLANFMNQYPHVHVSCHVHPVPMALQLLEENQIHFAMAAQTELRDTFEFIHYFSDQLVLVVPGNHPWAKKEKILPQELAQGKFILREETSSTYRAVQNALMQFDYPLENLECFLTLGNSEAIAIAVQEGLGVGFVSKIILERMGLNSLKQIKIEGLDIKQDIYLARHRYHPATRAALAFWEYARHHPK